MNLNLGQWAAVGVLVATHCTNPDLIAAVDAELKQARNQTQDDAAGEAGITSDGVCYEQS